jgi:hypothetical protein
MTGGGRCVGDALQGGALAARVAASVCQPSYVSDGGHPSRHYTPPSWSLLYVGISPSRAGSSRTVAARFAKDHVGGNIGGSTFRQSLAALLMSHLGLEPRTGSDRSRLVTEGPLSDWIDAACGLTFAEAQNPWQAERAVIQALNPPLNIDMGTHSFRADVSRCRAELKRACFLR